MCITTRLQADWNSKTPLHCAAAGGFGDIAKLLVESKADLKVGCLVINIINNVYKWLCDYDFMCTGRG